MSNVVDESVIKKIQGLLALASRGGTPEESATAAAAAQRLMDKHKLDRVSVEKQLVDEGIYDSRRGPALYEAEGKIVPMWIALLADRLGKLNQVYIYSTAIGRTAAPRLGDLPGTPPKPLGSIEAFGRKEDLQVVKYLFDYLRNEIDRLAKLHGGKGRTWLNNFRMAAVTTVCERVAQAKREAQTPYVGTTALVHVEKRFEVAQRTGRAALQAGGGRHGKKKSASRYDITGRAAGVQAGASIRLDAAGGLGSGQGRLGGGKK